MDDVFDGQALLVGFLQGTLDGSEIHHIDQGTGGDNLELACDFLRDLSDMARAIPQEQRTPFVGERLRGCETDAARRAGNESCTTPEMEIHDRIPLLPENAHSQRSTVTE